MDNLGPGGASFLERLFLCDTWAGGRLLIEQSVPETRRVGSPISVSAVPFWTRHRKMAKLQINGQFVQGID